VPNPEMVRLRRLHGRKVAMSAAGEAGMMKSIGFASDAE
jgi:hypothetical protein